LMSWRAMSVSRWLVFLACWRRSRKAWSCPRQGARRACPWACWMTTRLLRAACGCSAMASRRRTFRSCSKPTGAISARAWPIRRSPWPNEPRVSAEQVQRADDLLAQPHRHGLHGAEPGPVVAANRGHIWPGPVTSPTVTGCPVRKQSRHGPCSFWIWNSSTSPASSLEAAAHRGINRPGQLSCASGGNCSSRTARPGQHLPTVAYQAWDDASRTMQRHVHAHIRGRAGRERQAPRIPNRPGAGSTRTGTRIDAGASACCLRPGRPAVDPRASMARLGPADCLVYQQAGHF
jgi:hypothetical protein